MRPFTITRTLTGAALLTAALIAAAGSASAEVDLNPPPPSWYTCKPSGSGTICHGTMSFGHFAQSDGTCPQGFDLLENGHKDELGARYYDRDGDLIKRVLHDRFPEAHPLNVIYNSQTGASVPYNAYLTETDTFGTPGDFDTMTARLIGDLYTVTAPGEGLLAHDVGVLTFAPDGSVIEDRGPKLLFAGETEALCEALS